MSLVFITGPVRAGKSRFAERLARERGGAVTYVATARVDDADAEWCARIAHHRARRPREWTTVETARDGARGLQDVAVEAGAQETLLVDSFGTWVASLMGPGCDADVLEDAVANGVEALVRSAAFIIVVGDETGWGIVPEHPSGRLFRDVMGRAQQRLAAEATQAYLVVAGFAVDVRRYGIAV